MEYPIGANVAQQEGLRNINNSKNLGVLIFMAQFSAHLSFITDLCKKEYNGPKFGRTDRRR